ncbi:MAG: hypothetical protein OXR66_06170 [Candidatus Woesearchaeota archaeon]|nr:hypothetical protein [Candidatus Woesearchaeota archaeon]
MNCVVCEEVITNPVCPCCLHEGVGQWLSERGQTKIATQVEWVPHTTGDTHCIKCDQGMGICSYCYMGEMFDVVKQQPALIKEFLTFFNFDLEHLGWEQEARAYLGE